MSNIEYHHNVERVFRADIQRHDACSPKLQILATDKDITITDDVDDIGRMVTIPEGYVQGFLKAMEDLRDFYTTGADFP